MKLFKTAIAILLMSMAFVNEAAAKKNIKTEHMYMFGFSASFQDSTLYITDIQDVYGVWYDKKQKYIRGLEDYSSQLNTYLTEQLNQPNRVCMVFYAPNKKKAEKKYKKLQKKYVVKNKGLYNILYLTEKDFKFEAIDMSVDE